MIRFRQFWGSVLGKACTYTLEDASACYKDHVARPCLCLQIDSRFSWAHESVLFLGLGIELVGLARELSNRGASIEFRSLTKFQEVYQLPLEKFTMVIMDDCSIEETFDVIDVGATLRRCCNGLVLVWASTAFIISQAADRETKGFCDVKLALPSSPEEIAHFLT